jgi:tetratricopeptide (TPR) repeat protein
MLEAYGEAATEGFKLAVLLLFLGIVASAIVGRLVEGELSATEGVIVILLPIVSLVLALIWWKNSLIVLLSCSLCLGVVMLWVLHHISEQRIRRWLDEQEIERYKATIKSDPKNAAAHSMLGDVYLRLKRYDEAIKEFEEALKLDPLSQSDRYKLRLAKEKKLEAELRGVACPRCHNINPRIAARCQKCDYELNRSFAIDFVAWITQPDSLKRVITTTLLLIIPLSFFFSIISLLPSFLRAIVWLCLFATFLIWLRKSIL